VKVWQYQLERLARGHLNPWLEVEAFQAIDNTILTMYGCLAGGQQRLGCSAKCSSSELCSQLQGATTYMTLEKMYPAQQYTRACAVRCTCSKTICAHALCDGKHHLCCNHVAEYSHLIYKQQQSKQQVNRDRQHSALCTGV
jgi:hypothetical protein